MESPMKRNKRFLAASVLAMIFPLASHAESINVDFTATVIASTCNIKLTALNGSSVTDNGGDKYTLTIPNVGLDKIENATTAAQADFKLVATECSAGLNSIVTKITGTTISGKLIKNTLTDTTAAENLGMGFKLVNTEDSEFITPDGSSSVTWDANNIANGLDMTVALREITQGQGTPGDFESSATFSFTYN